MSGPELIVLAFEVVVLSPNMLLNVLAPYGFIS